MGRRSFPLSETTIVVSTDGYFDVYPPVPRTDGDKPAYRGRLHELGAGIRGADDRLAVRPSSTALAEAVVLWSSTNGARAPGGKLGGGRDANEVHAVASPPTGRGRRRWEATPLDQTLSQT